MVQVGPQVTGGLVVDPTKDQTTSEGWTLKAAAVTHGIAQVTVIRRLHGEL